MDRNEERGGRRGGGEREFEDRYRQRYAGSGEDRDRMGWRDEDDGDRERRFGRFGRFDEDRNRDDDRPRYQGWGGQSGSQAGGMSDNMYREQTGYRDRDMYRRESTGYGYGGGYGGQEMGRGGERYGMQQGGYGGESQRYGMQQGGYGGESQRYGGGMPQGGYGGYGEQYNTQRDSWGTGGQSQGRDFGGTLGHVDRPYRQQGGSQYGTSGPFGGGHRGKGPSGYTRSDERIREDVCDALSDDDNIDASNIDIQVKNGEVTLTGTVTDRRTKRMAEDCVEHVRGVKDVTNNIRVQDREREHAGNGGRSHTSQSVSSSPDKDVDTSKRPRA